MIFFNNDQYPHQISVYIEFWTTFFHSSGNEKPDLRLTETVEINARQQIIMENKENPGRLRKI